MKDETKARLEHLRQELRAERISTAELIELSTLADKIEPGDVELLEAAGVPEYQDSETFHAELAEAERVLVDDATRDPRIRGAMDAYLECAVWSSYDYSACDPYDDEAQPVPMDDNYSVSDMSDSCKRILLADLVRFMSDPELADDLSNLNPDQIGHDLWLTQNGHGAGFWDRGLGEVGTRLTDAAHKYGNIDLYVHDGKIEVA